MNHRFQVFVLAGSSLLAFAGGASADVLHLNTGGRLEGVVVRETATSLTIDVGMGEISVPRTSVARIERRESALSEYRTRMAATVPGNVIAYADLARFAAEHSLRNEARLAWTRVLAYDPRNVEAHLGLGHVLLDGEYVDETVANRARGFVLFDGRWMSPAEQGSILREREQRLAYEHEIAAARRAAREAEDRARQAEAAAQQARAEANASYPLWGYGGVYVGSPYWNGGYGANRPGYYPGYPGCVGCGNRPHVSPRGPAAPPVTPQAPPVRPSSIR